MVDVERLRRRLLYLNLSVFINLGRKGVFPISHFATLALFNEALNQLSSFDHRLEFGYMRQVSFFIWCFHVFIFQHDFRFFDNQFLITWFQIGFLNFHHFYLNVILVSARKRLIRHFLCWRVTNRTLKPHLRCFVSFLEFVKWIVVLLEVLAVNTLVRGGVWFVVLFSHLCRNSIFPFKFVVIILLLWPVQIK